MKLALDKHFSGQQQVSMFSDRPRQRVLDRNHGDRNIASLQPVEHLGGPHTGNHAAASHHPPCGFVAERASLSLDGNSHLSKLSGEACECKSFSSSSASTPFE